MAATPDEDNNRWNIQEEISKVFQIALDSTFPGEEPWIVFIEDNKDVGDYQCNNILTIWPQVRDKGTYEDCKAVGEAIVNNLPAPDMMECNIEGPGFILIKLSSQWIAESIHKMLIDGIDTWAPKLPVKKAIVDFSSRNIGEEMNMGHLRSIIIGDTIARMFEYSKVDVIRRSHVGDGGIQIGMLIEFLLEIFRNEIFVHLPIAELELLYMKSRKKFNKNAEFRKRAQLALVSLAGGDKRYQNAYDQICEISRKDYKKVYQRLGVDVEEKGKIFYHCYIPDTVLLLKDKGLIEGIGQDLVISIEQKKLYEMKNTKGCKYDLTLLKGGVDATNALIDLTALWYQLEKEKAEWILYVSDLQQREHTTLFVYAAKHAEWLAAGPRDYPRGSHVGYGLVQGDDLNGFHYLNMQVVDLLEEAKSRCKAALVERAEANEWTVEQLDCNAEALAYGAVKYADLKNHRLEKYTFNFDEMLNDKENTAVHLLHTHARICTIIRKSGKDMYEIKKVGEIKLETDEERELGLHLLQFPDAIENTCRYFLPHFLCEYLYKLSKKFTSFYPNSSVCQVGSAVETSTSRLLLCKATAVVMKKCFHLLGITTISDL